MNIEKIVLKLISLNDDNSIKKYNSIIKNEFIDNPLYRYQFIHRFTKNASRLLCFVLENENETIAVMPIIKREISVKLNDTKYFDVISPYGYSGPLYKNDMNLLIKIHFWRLVDQWYESNNVVSEFIRFNLNKNYLGYTGIVIPTLKNVIGKILKNQEVQWQNYLPKVRNNYRKAIGYNLKSDIYAGNKITDDKLNIFYDIYLQTLTRNNASKTYFFPLSYFKSLINTNPNGIFLAFASKNDVIIAAELLIQNKEEIFAYLAGSNSQCLFYRPNDFLRVEIIKWASKRNIEKYILGGGMHNSDGLYRHKKSFFPKDPDKDFLTGRKIINKTVYIELLKLSNPDALEKEFSVGTDIYFPAYRK